MYTKLQEGYSAPLRFVIERAPQRGELPKTTDIDVVVAALTGPLFYRRWFSREPLTRSFVKQIIRRVLCIDERSASFALARDQSQTPIIHIRCVQELRMKQVRKPSAERTNIVLDPKLIDRVKRLANVKTTRDAVHVALEHYVRSRDYSGVLGLRGTGGVSGGYDPKATSPPR
jgi:Arc/MetJ family transcription regulator